MTLRKALLVFVLGLLLLPLMVEAAPAPRIGDQVPEISLPARSGQHYQLSELRGNYVLINFWATWCIGCNLVKNPEYKAIYNKYKTSTFKNAKGFTMFSVAFDENVEKWERKITEQQLSWPYHVIDRLNHDSPFWNIFQIRTLPANVLIDANGEIVAKNISGVQLDLLLEEQQSSQRREPIMPPQNIVLPPTAPPVVTSGATTRFQTPPPVVAPARSTPYKTLPPAVAPSKSRATYKTTTTPVTSGATPKRYKAYYPVTPTTKTGPKQAYKTVAPVAPAPNAYKAPAPVVTLPHKNTPKVATSTYSTNTKLPIKKAAAFSTVYKIQLAVHRHQSAMATYQRLNDLGRLEWEPVPNQRLGRVQLGVFDEGYAFTVLQKVKQRGYKDAFLVRVQRKLPAQTPTLVETAPTYQTMSNKQSYANKGATNTIPNKPAAIRYKIQLGAFKAPNLRAFQNLQDLGAIEVEAVPGKNLKRVLLGNYNLQEANRILQLVKRRGINNAYVVKREGNTSSKPVLANNWSSSNRSINKQPLAGKTKRKSLLNRSAPEIVLEALKGKETPLYSMRNKVTLLYFWSPISSSTMDHHLELNRIYHLFKDEKFEIFGVAFDKNRQLVRQILDRDQVHWNIHLIDTNGLNSDIIRRYQVEYLPALFLVDESGVIIAENLNYEKAEELLQQHFKKKK